MANPELQEFVKQQLARGIPADALRTVLIQRGWPVPDIDAALGLPIKAAPAPVTASPTAESVASIPVRISSEPAAVVPNFAQPVTAATLPIAKKSHWGLIIGLVAGVAILGAGGAWAYMTYFPAPEKVLNKSFNAISQVTSLEFAGNLTVEGSTEELTAGLPVPLPVGQASDKFKLTIDINGTSDTKSFSEPHSSLSIAFTGKDDAGKDGGFNMDFKSIGKIIYARFPTLGNLGFVDLTSLKNRWIKIDPEAISKSLGGSEPTGDSLNNQASSPDEENHLRSAIQNSSLITIIGKLPSEKIDGVATHHYGFAINREGVKKFIKTMREATGETDNVGLEEAYREIDAVKQLPAGEIWIGKSDYLPRKILVVGEYKIENSTTSKEVTPIKYSLTFDLKNFNQPLTVEAPTDARNLEDVINEFLGPMMMGLFSGAPSQPQALMPLSPTGLGSGIAQPELHLNNTPRYDPTDTDNDNLPDALERLIGTNINSKDTDGDGFNDDLEIERGYNPNGAGKLSPENKVTILTFFTGQPSTPELFDQFYSSAYSTTPTPIK